MTLRDFPFCASYGPSDDRLHEFYVSALKASVHCDRILARTILPEWRAEAPVASHDSSTNGLINHYEEIRGV